MTPRPQHQTNGRKKRTLNILRLYRQGKTKQQIADMFGITTQAVSAILVRTGVRQETGQ